MERFSFNFNPDVAFVPRGDLLEDVTVAVGEAVFWALGEEHETRSAVGLTALISEGDDVDRFRKQP